jgi:hypothetical protein
MIDALKAEIIRIVKERKHGGPEEEDSGRYRPLLTLTPLSG